jgi:NAD-dependent deacetylase
VTGLDAVAAAVSAARRILVVTGAGMSADAGLPTYRGVGGLYRDVDTTEDGVPIEVALSGEMLRQRPEVTWRHLRRIESATRGARPHPGHAVLARLEARAEVTILTQNVDGLHQAAGSTDVIEVHGNVRNLFCACGWTEHRDDWTDLAPVPRCPRCDAVIRPAVVLFGEMLPPEAVRRMSALGRPPFDVVFAIGTTAVFPYVVAPVLEQVRRGGVAVEIDPGETALSARITHRLRAGAAEALTALEARLR